MAGLGWVGVYVLRERSRGQLGFLFFCVSQRTSKFLTSVEDLVVELSE